MPDRSDAPHFFQVRHLTRFRYSEPVREAVMTVHKQPRNDVSQYVESFEIHTTPRAVVTDFEDCFGNPAAFFDVPGEHRTLEVEARSVVALRPRELNLDDRTPGWDAMEGLRVSDVWHFLNPTPLTAPTALLAPFLKEHGIDRRETPLASLRNLATSLHGAITYDPGATQVHSAAHDALEDRRGVCQDFAHIMLAVARGWGIPARYTSGYLHVEKADDPDARMARVSHAWVECLLPGLGWVGFDPTNDSTADRRHIRVAAGRDYRDVPPTRGTFRGTADQTLEVSVTIGEIPPDSRSDGAWPEAALET